MYVPMRAQKARRAKGRKSPSANTHKKMMEEVEKILEIDREMTMNSGSDYASEWEDEEEEMEFNSEEEKEEEAATSEGAETKEEATTTEGAALKEKIKEGELIAEEIWRLIARLTELGMKFVMPTDKEVEQLIKSKRTNNGETSKRNTERKRKSTETDEGKKRSRTNGGVSTEEKVLEIIENEEGETEKANKYNYKEKFPPPITVDEATDVNKINKIIKERKINLNKPARQNRKGIQYCTESPDDFRTLVKVLKENEIEFFTYQLQEEKEFMTVIKGVPTAIDTEEVKESLEEQGIRVNKVTRMGNSKRKLPLVIVNAPKEEDSKEIYKIKQVANMAVTVVPKYRPAESRQCYRCQRFGHIAYRCNYERRCLKCAENHISSTCNTKTPKCANCKGNHMASNWDCEHHPRRINERKELERRKKLEDNARRPETSYAAAAFKGKERTSTEKEEMGKKISEVLMKILPKILAELV